MNPHMEVGSCSQRSSWSDLPSDLLELIADIIEDLPLFRSICKSWNSSIVNKLNKKKKKNVGPPLLHRKLPRKFPQITPWSNPTIVSTAVFILRRHINGPRWLVGVQQFRSYKFCIVHPLTHHRLAINLPKGIRDFVPLRITTAYSTTSRCTSGIKSIYWENKSNSSPDLVVTLTHRCTLLLSNLGDDKNPRTLIYGRRKKFTDIALWKNRIWAVDDYGRVYGIDFHTENITTVLATSANMKDGYERQKRLFESNGKLYLVVKKERLHDIQVCVLNPSRNVWEKVASLDDSVLFISYDSCFFAKTSDLLLESSNCGNSIVFPAAGCFSFTPKERLSFNKATFDLHLHLLVYDYGKSSSDNVRPISSYPALSAVIWPPPSWIYEGSNHPYGSKKHI